MNSLVLELQALASDSKEKLSDLLRKALVVATKLGVEDFRSWIQHELRGYPPQEVPEYRICGSQIFGRDPYRDRVPVVFPDEEMEELFCEVRITDPVEALQHALDEKNQDGSVAYSIPPTYDAELRRAIGAPGIPLVRLVSVSVFSGILDTVRTTILEWALELESEGILGEGMSFTPEEKKKAEANPHISITNFHGILGNVTGGEVHQNTLIQIQRNDFESLEKALTALGLSASDISELQDALNHDPRPQSADKFGPKVGRWLGNMVQKAAEGGLNIVIKVSSAVLTDALKKYYGLDGGGPP